MKLSIVIPAYFTDVHSVLFRNLDNYCKMKESVRKELEVIVVDDCSKTPIDLSKYRDILNISLFRIDIDISWNQPGARNLGCVHVNNKWIYVTDVDHYIPEKTVEYILENMNNFNEMHIRYFYRINPDNTELANKKPLGRVGSALISKKVFDMLGGWDERFSGSYGGDDKEFINRARREGCAIVDEKTFNLISLNSAIDYTSKKEYHNLKRHFDRNKKIPILKKRNENILNFKWHKVFSYE